MKLVCVAVFDSASQAYGRPFFVQSRGVAVRSFTDEVRRVDPNNDLNKHPEDFTLVHLGTFDDSNGSFDSNLETLLRGKDAVSEV